MSGQVSEPSCSDCPGLQGPGWANGGRWGSAASRAASPWQPLRCIHFKCSLASLSVLFTEEPAGQRVKEGATLLALGTRPPLG